MSESKFFRKMKGKYGVLSRMLVYVLVASLLTVSTFSYFTPTVSATSLAEANSNRVTYGLTGTTNDEEATKVTDDLKGITFAELLNKAEAEIKGKAVKYSELAKIDAVDDNESEESGMVPQFVDTENDTTIQLPKDPFTNVEAIAGDRKIALIFPDFIDSIITAFEIKIDNRDWMTINVEDLDVDENSNRQYYLFENLINGKEYTFQVRTISEAGVSGDAVEVKSTPVSIEVTGQNVVQSLGSAIQPLGVGLPIMLLSYDPFNPGLRIVQLVEGENEYRVDMRPHVTRTTKYLYSHPSFGDQYLIGAWPPVPGVVNTSTPVAYNEQKILWVKYVENFFTHQTELYYQLVVVGPPSGNMIYMASLAGQPTHPPEGGAGTKAAPFFATINVPLGKSSIAYSDIVMTEAGGMSFLYPDNTYDNNTYLTSSETIPLHEGKNQVYTGIFSGSATSGTRILYYDITVIRGFGFSKDVNSVAYIPGGTLDYNISMKLPSNVGVYSDIRVLDTYPADKMSYAAGSAILSINGGAALTPGVDYVVTDDVIGNEGTVTVRILRNLTAFANGQLDINLGFNVDANASGKILNRAHALFDGVRGGEDEAEIDKSDFSKEADIPAYVPGAPLGYTINFKLPENLDLASLNSVVITDIYNPSQVSYVANSAAMTLNGAAFTGYTVSTTPAGTITISLTPGGISSLTSQANITLKLTFNVNATTTGTIRNDANIKFNGKDGGNDFVEIEKSDFAKTADRVTYVQGGQIGYTLDVTVPKYDEYTSLVLRDEYTPGTVSYRTGSAVMTKNGSPMPPAEYTFNNNAATGVITVTLTQTGLTNLRADDELALSLIFDVSDTATGVITNEGSYTLNGKDLPPVIVVVGPSDFKKEASVAAYTPGASLDYTINFKLPENLDLATLNSVVITDTYNPSQVSYAANSAAMTLNGAAFTEYTVSTIPAGMIVVSLTHVGIASLTDQASITLNLTFNVYSTTTGTIRNDADVKFNGEDGGDDFVEIDKSDFKKESNLVTYLPGGAISYDITYTVPGNNVTHESMVITDNYDQTKVDFRVGSDVLTIGTGAAAVTLVRNVDYTINNNVAVGILTFTLTTDGLNKLSSGAAVKLTTTFDVKNTATGVISNKAEFNYNGKPGGDDGEDVDISDFSKDAESATYVPGGTIKYGMNFTMPVEDVLDTYTSLIITDNYDRTKVSFISNSDVLRIGTGATAVTLTRDTDYTIANNSVAGTVTVSLLQAGLNLLSPGIAVSLNLEFATTAQTRGKIVNNAHVTYNGKPGAGDKEEVDISNFKKDADRMTYVPGGDIGYELTFTLPEQAADYANSLAIVDNYDRTRVNFKTDSDKLTIGTQTLDRGADYSVTNNQATGMLRIELTAAGLAKAPPNAAVKLELVFTALSTATGMIRNNAYVIYNGKPGAGDSEEVRLTDFSKDGQSNYYEPGADFEYTLSVTLPAKVTGTNTITIYDDYDASSMSYNNGSAVLTIGNVTLNNNQFTVANDAANGLLTVTIQNSVYPFANLGELPLTLKLTFTVNSNAFGSIRNEAGIHYDGKPGGDDDEIIDINNFTKESLNIVYVPGDKIEYKINTTLPGNINERSQIQIIDEYNASMVRYQTGSAVLRIGTTTLTPGVHYTVNDDGAGVLRITILKSAYSFANLGNLPMELRLGFNVLAGAKGTLKNDSRVEYDGNPGGRDDENVEQSDFNKDSDSATFSPGFENDYTISVTLPDRIDEISTITIHDEYAANYVKYVDNSAVLTIDGVVLTGAQYTLVNSPAAGVLTVTIQDSAYPFAALGSKELKLKLTFEVLFRLDYEAGDKIKNYAKIVYDQKLGGEDEEEVVLAMGPVTDVNEYPGDMKTALTWKNPTDGGVVDYFQIKIDDYDWVTYSLSDLEYDSVRNHWYLLFRNLPDNGPRLQNGVEYTFLIRAVNSVGLVGAATEVKSTPDPMGDIGGRAADLISIHGFRVMPDDGWPFYVGGPGFDTNFPYEASVEIPIALKYSTIHVNDIVVSGDATFEMYASWRWSGSPQVLSIDRIDEDFEWIDTLYVYIKVTSSNREVIRYYIIEVNTP